MKDIEKQSLRTNLQLIKTVHDNYTHIVELESLRNLFHCAVINERTRKSSYKKHYEFLLEIVDNTISSHYENYKNLLLVDDVNNKLMEVYGNYQDDIEFDLLNEFEKNM